MPGRRITMEFMDRALQTVSKLVGFKVSLFLWPITVALGAGLILFLIRGLLLRILKRWSASTKTAVDDIMVAALRGPSVLWCLAGATHVGFGISEVPARYVSYVTKTVDVFIVLSITMVVANLIGRLLGRLLQSSSIPMPSTGLFQGTIKGLIFTIGFLFVLTSLGISITPLVTTLGVGGLAVALALQDTLANLIAGIHILLEKSIRVGDFVKVESGEEGYVEDITWRTTRIRMLPNNMVVIPNGKLAKSTVTNYYLPEKRMSLPIGVGVSYSSDPRRVAEILVEVAKSAVGEIPGLRAEPEPFVRFIPGFGDSSLDFTLICQVDEFTDQYFVQHELRMRIFERFAAEGIEIPFPQRTVHLTRR
jgi:small-conductance mechanosensitive channel